MRHLPYRAQTLEGEVLIDEIDAARDPAHLLAEPARGHHLHLRAQFGAHAIHQPVDEARPAVHDAGLDVRDGVAADGLLRLEELDAIEARRPRDQCFGGGHEAGRDRPAHEFPARVHAVEGGGRAEVDHDEGLAIQGDAAHDVAQAIGPDLVGRVDEKRHRVDPSRIDGEGLDPEVRVRHRLQRLLHRRHHVGNGDAGEARPLYPPGGEQCLDEDAVLVGRLLAPRGEAPRHERARSSQASRSPSTPAARNRAYQWSSATSTASLTSSRSLARPVSNRTEVASAFKGSGKAGWLTFSPMPRIRWPRAPGPEVAASGSMPQIFRSLTMTSFGQRMAARSPPNALRASTMATAPTRESWGACPGGTGGRRMTDMSRLSPS